MAEIPSNFYPPVVSEPSGHTVLELTLYGAGRLVKVIGKWEKPPLWEESAEFAEPEPVHYGNRCRVTR